MKRTITLLAQFLVLCVVLSFEHVFSLPILFFALILIFFEWQPPIYRQIMLAILSMVFAIEYQVSFTLSVMLFMALIGGNSLVGNHIRNQSIKVILISSVTCLITLIFSQFKVTSESLIAAISSCGLIFIVTHFVQFESRSGLSGSNVGWIDEV